MPDAGGEDGGLLDPEVVGQIPAGWGAGLPRFPASDEGLTAEFLIKVHDFARQWLEERGGPVGDSAPCVFVQARSIVQQAEELNAPALPYFSSMPDQEVAGRVFIANSDLSVVHEVPAGGCAAIPQIAGVLAGIGLSDQMHAVFRPDRGELIVCDSGLNGASRRMPVSMGAYRRLIPPELEQEVWQFHRRFTQTPSGFLICWRGAAVNRLTIENAERQISALLTFYVMLSVGSDNVTMEDHTQHGRADIYVSSHGMAPGIGGCILELKVLRSREYSSNDERGYIGVSDPRMVRHATDGVMQAREYLDDKRASLGYLLCFDARLADADQPEVLAVAKSQGVKVGRYFMYDSPASARAARLAASQSAAPMPGEPPL